MLTEPLPDCQSPLARAGGTDSGASRGNRTEERCDTTRSQVVDVSPAWALDAGTDAVEVTPLSTPHISEKPFLDNFRVVTVR